MEQKTMKAYVLRGPDNLVLEDVAVPQIQEPTDVIAKVTLTTLCRSDILSISSGWGPVANVIQGHEFTCTVVEAGSEVKDFKVGDRCLAAPAASCGECPRCKAGLYSSCTTYGAYGSNPNVPGSFAEYIRIPMADRNLYHIADGMTEEDMIFAGDVLATGMWAAQEAGVKEGSTVLVFGCGPIGMGAVMTAKKILKAGRVIVADVDQNRLDLMKDYADVLINSAERDPDDVVMELTNDWGVDAVVDSVGRDATMNLAIDCLRPGGTLMSFSIRYEPWEVNWFDVVLKNLTLKAGVATLNNIPPIIKAIEDGEIDAKFMQTHFMPLNNLLDGLDIFRNYKDGCIKVMITPYEHDRDLEK